MTSGRWRFDKPLDQYFTKKQQNDPDLLLDEQSEVTGPPQHVEDDPPEKNADEGLAFTVKSPDPIPVTVVPGPSFKYRTYTAHGYTVKCFDGVPKQILGQNDSRITARIRNVGSGTPTVSLGSNADEARADGFPLEALDDLIIVSNGPVWGCVKTGNSTDVSTVGVWVEYAWVIE